ncbi:MAG: GAF domain-containing protein [Anaerolineales bacterium]|nr:GAF domain-containing protein [Anaerolineales bacterium]MCB8939335.1 GAF domain-containing protein [Ardenticatenaceae bacterium]
MDKETDLINIEQRATVISSILAGVTVFALLTLLGQLLFNDIADISALTLAAIWVVGALSVVTLFGARYCRNGRTQLGMGLIAAGFLFLVLIIPFVVKGRAIYTATITVGLVVIIAPQLLSLRVINRVVSAFVIVGILSIALDVWLPYARTIPTVRPYAVYVFGLGLIILVVFTAIQYHRMRLRTKILSFLVFMPLLIVASVSAFFIVRFTAQQRVRIEQDIQASVQEQGDDIFAFLANADADIQLLSHTYALENYLRLFQAGASEADLAEAKLVVQEEFVNFAQTRLIYYQIRFLDATGQEVVRIDTTTDGITTVIPEDELQNKASRPYFAEAAKVQPGELYISPLELNVERGEIERPFKPVIRYGTPVYLDGVLQGVVVTNIYADFFLKPLSQISDAAYLVDQDGYFLLHPDATKAWGRDLETNVVISQELPDIANELPTISDNEQFLETQTDLFAIAPISLEGETTPRWFLLNARPLQAVLAPINLALEPVQNVLAVAMMLTPLLALFISQSIASPIMQLSEAAEKMGQGNFDVVIDVTTQDEVGVLANTLNQMSAELGELIESLETRVAERTKDLTLAVDVSNQVAQVHALETMLVNAVALIRDRFDLYYTQIYLTEGTTLRLAAGSGQVGQQLLQRGHTLLIGPGSINGTAVAEKRSIIVADTANSPIFKPNPLLPLTRSEMSVPLIARNTVVGVLNLQSAEPEALTDENLNAFEVLAGQLASAIENARLFTELNEARASVEAQMNMLTREGWDNYLDGVRNREFLGFAYEAGRVTAVAKPAPVHQNQQKWDIQLLGEKLGELIVEPPANASLPPAAAELIQNVSEQIAQQIENLRLLNDAQRYRQEAETAVRRLTREGWQSYQTQNDLPGFVYDQHEVKPLNLSEADVPEQYVNVPLQVHEETIGYLQLDNVEKTLDAGAQQLFTAVAQQLSNHINSLRLSQQTQQALAQTEQLYKVGSALNQASDVQSILDVAITPIKPEGVNEAVLMFVDLDKVGQPNILEVLANWRLDGNASFPVGTRFTLEEFPFTNLFMSNPQEPQFISDVSGDARVDAYTRQVMQQVGIGAIVVVPLTIAGQWVGILTYSWPMPYAFSQPLKDFSRALINLTAPVIQSQRLFAKTRAQADKEHLINVITQRIQEATTMENALQTAVSELGRALQAKHATVKLDLNELQNGHS